MRRHRVVVFQKEDGTRGIGYLGVIEKKYPGIKTAPVEDLIIISARQCGKTTITQNQYMRIMWMQILSDIKKESLCGESRRKYKSKIKHGRMIK